MMRAGLSQVLVLAMTMASGVAGGAQEERTKVRLLYSFEKASDAKELLREAEHVEVDIVQDNGVTHGNNCARLVFEKGVAWAYFTLGTDAVRNWSDFDYFAMDVYAEDTHPYRVVFELWDAASRNYHTRCTFENTTTHPGKQTLMWQINRAKRNGKEGREWHELEPRDKIQMDGLTRVPNNYNNTFLLEREKQGIIGVHRKFNSAKGMSPLGRYHLWGLCIEGIIRRPEFITRPGKKGLKYIRPFMERDACIGKEPILVRVFKKVQ